MLLLAVAFVAGIVALMTVLSGRFEAKVPMTTAATGTIGLSWVGDRPTAEVRLVRRHRREPAVGTIRAVHEAVVASRILRGSRMCW